VESSVQHVPKRTRRGNGSFGSWRWISVRTGRRCHRAVVAAISVGAAAGGYHYVLDVILGLIVAAAAAAVAGLL
jgi:hypothetical protein